MASPITVDIEGRYKDAEINRAMRDLDKLRKKGDTLSSRMEEFGGKFQGFGRSVSKFGGTLTKTVTLPLVGLGAVAVKSFSDFDKELTKSTSIMGDVSEEVRDRMSDAARGVATSLGIAHSEAAESFYFLASAGMDAEQSIAAMPQVAAFAKAGMFDMARATDLATDAQSALGMTSDDAGENLDQLTRVTDVFVKASTLANASVEEFSESITAKAGVALANTGKDIEEGAAVLAVFAEKGIKGSQAGTLLTRTLEGLMNNAEKNSEAFEELGIKVFDSDGAMRPMVDIVEDLEGAFDGMSVEQKNAALGQLGFNKLAKEGILALTGSSDKLADFEAGMRNAGGITEEVANKQLETFAEQMNLLRAQFVDMAIDIGPVLIEDFLKPLAAQLGKVADWFKQLSPETRQTIVRFLMIAAAIGPVILIVGKLITAFGTIIIAVVKVVAIFGKVIALVKIIIGVVGALGAALKILGLAFWAATGPIGLIVLAIVALIAIFVALYKNNETVRKFIDATWKAIQAVFRVVIGWIVNWVKTNFETIKNAVMVAIDIVKKVIETAWAIIRRLFDMTPIGLVIKHWDTLKNATQTAFKAVSDFIRGFLDVVRGMVRVVGDTIGKVIKFYRELPGKIIGALKGAATWLYDIGRNIIQGLLNGAGSLLKNIGQFFLDRLPGWIQGPFKKALGISSPSTVFAGYGRNLIEGLVAGLESQEGLTKETVKKTITDVFTSTRDELRGAVKAIEADMSSMAKSVSDAIFGIIDFGAAAPEIGEDGERIGQSFIEKLTEQANKAVEFAGKIRSLIAAGLAPEAIQMVIAAGAVAGTAIADELIEGGATAIDTTNELVRSTREAADEIGKETASNFYATGLASAKQTLKAFVDQFGPNGAGRSRLMGLMDRLAGAMNRTSIITVITRHVSEGIPGRRMGGPVAAGSPYIVGEAGPELFVPTMSGRILPNHSLSDSVTGRRGMSMGGAQSVINLTVNAGIGTDGAEVGRVIVDSIKQYERRNGKVYVAA